MSSPIADMSPPDFPSAPQRRPSAEPAAALRASVLLPRDGSCGSVARAWLDAEIAPHVGESVLASARLVATELVTNAVRHGRGTIELRAELADRRLRLHVIDEGRGRTPGIREEGGGSHGGWGLQIVDALSARWGAFEGTTHVWADLSLDA